MGKKQIKIQIYNLNATKDEVLNYLGIILDNICISAITEENLLTGEYYLDAEFILDSEGLWKNIVEEAVIKVKLDYGEELFSIAKVNKKGNRIIIFARQITIQESLSLWLDDVRPENKDGLTAITYLLDNSIGIKNITVSSNITTINTAYYQKINLYNALHSCDQSFQNRWGGEIQRRGYNLKIDKKIGENRGVQIRSRKNLTGFEGNTNIDTVITRIKPVGADGIEADYVDSEYIKNYKYIKTEKIEYKDVKVKDTDSENDEGFDTLEEAQAELIRLAKLEYSNNKVDILQAEYDINFVDLSQTEEYKEYIQVERIYLGDEIQVIEDKYNINITVRAIKRYYDVLKQRVKEITLSTKDAYNKPPTINQIKNELEQKIEENKTYYDKALENVNSLINQGLKDSYVVVRQNEILIMDSTDINTAINVWRWNKGGLGFSSTGYNGTYETAITMDGNIVARFLTGLLVKGDQIDARNLVVGDTISISSEGFLSVIQGLINIDKEGIRINLIDSEDNILGYVLYDGQGVQIFTTQDEAISHLTREGSYIDNLVANHIKCDELLKDATLSGCPTTWFIAEKATGDGTGRDEENKANSLKDVLRRIQRYGQVFTNKISIIVESGILEENYLIQDVYGTVFEIILSKNVILKNTSFILEDNTARIFIKGETNGIKATDESITSDEINSRALLKASDTLFIVRNCNFVEINGLKIRGNGGNMIEANTGSNVYVEDCDISNFDNIYLGYSSATLALMFCRGSIGKVGETDSCANIASTSYIPKISDSEIVHKYNGGLWDELESYTQLDTLYQETTISSEATNTKESFNLSNLYTVVEGTGLNTASRKGYTGQGKFKSYKSHRGYIILPSAEIMSALQNKNSYALKLKMTRLNTEHGYNSKTPHPIIRAIGNGIETDYWDCGITFARGESQVLTLPDALKDAIKNGATRLELWAEDNKEQQYSFYNNVNLIIEGANKETGGSGDDSGQTTEETIADFTYADALVEVAMTYYRVCDNEYTEGQPWSQGFTYRASNTPMSANCEAEQGVTNSLWVKVANSDGSSVRNYKAIDCSTGGNLWLRAISYETSPYKSEELFNAFRKNRLQKNNDVVWSISPTRADGKPARYAYELCNYFYRVGKGIVFLKDPDTGTILKGSIGTSEDDYSNIKKGDIIFHAKKDSNGNWKRPNSNEFMHVSHVAVCYGHSNTYGKKAIIESTNVTTKKHTFADGTSYNAGIRIKQIETYAEDIVMVVRLQESHYSSSSGDSSGSTTTETQEYTNCYNTTGVIDGNNYIYKLGNCKVTSYGGDGSSGCNIPLNLGRTCGMLNVPYGTKIYIPSLKGKIITDGNGKTVTMDGILTVNDCGVGMTDCDIYMSTYSDTNAENIFGNPIRTDIYVLEWGSGYGMSWSFTQSYKWAYNNGGLSQYKSAFKNYIQYGGTLINLLKFKNDDADIRSSTYWEILNS